MKLIVFDFDGTLVDSRALILECHRTVFTEFGLALPSQRDSLSLIGKSLELVLAELAGANAPIAEMVVAYGRVLPQLRADSAFAEMPFDGIGGLLADLSLKSGVVLGIATGHTSAAVAPALDALGWRQFFGRFKQPTWHPRSLIRACFFRHSKLPAPSPRMRLLSATRFLTWKWHARRSCRRSASVGDTMEPRNSSQLAQSGWFMMLPNFARASGTFSMIDNSFLLLL
jgi:phosphoglycolate phosphatase-like HAD superfamily hydrolase